MSTKKKLNDDDDDVSDDPLMGTSVPKPGYSSDDKQPEENDDPHHPDDVVDDGLPNQSVSLGCGILGRYPILSLLCFVITGVGVGIGLSYWRPTTEDGINSKAVALVWINLGKILDTVHLFYFRYRQ